MTTDIVERLRQHALPDPHDEREVLHAPLLREAADEIERLRRELNNQEWKKLNYLEEPELTPDQVDELIRGVRGNEQRESNSSVSPVDGQSKNTRTSSHDGAPTLVGWFVNDAPEGETPHYSQCAVAFAEDEDVVPLFIHPPRKDPVQLVSVSDDMGECILSLDGVEYRFIDECDVPEPRKFDEAGFREYVSKNFYVDDVEGIARAAAKWALGETE